MQAWVTAKGPQWAPGLVQVSVAERKSALGLAPLSVAEAPVQEVAAGVMRAAGAEAPGPSWGAG